MTQARRPSRRYSTLFFGEPLTGGEVYRLEGPVFFRRATGPWDIRAPSDDGMQVAITHADIPLSSIVRSGALPVSLEANAYSIARSELDAFLEMGRAGQLTGQRFRFDEQDATGEYDEAFRDHWIPSVDDLELTKTHVKSFVLEHEMRTESIVSSSNDGLEGRHVEWWASSRDPGLAEFLRRKGGLPLAVPAPHAPIGKIPGAAISYASRLLPSPLAQTSIVRAGCEIPSSAILSWLIESMGGRVDLNLVSWSTSIGFVEALAEMRKIGMLGSLDWSIDRSMKSRKATASEGKVMQSLEATFPGEVSFPGRIHGKWAVLACGEARISVLTSANWQLTNPREELYLVSTDPELARQLCLVQAEMAHGLSRAKPTLPNSWAARLEGLETARDRHEFVQQLILEFGER